MQDNRIAQAQVYTDLQGLNALKTEARHDKQAALRQVAKQFESLFLAEMLKSMRKAGDVLSEGNYMNSQQSKFYRDMFDKQLSVTLAGNQGTGLADVMVRQLSQQIPGMQPDGQPLAAHRASLADYRRSAIPVSPQLPEQLNRVRALEAPSSVATDTAAQAAAPEAVAGDAPTLPARFDSPEQFVQTLLPLARRAAGDSGIDPQVMVAQAALETGWGKHMIEGEGGQPSHNLFGIKADARWAGGSVAITTTEYRNGLPLKEQADFRAYGSYEDSFRDYVDFLQSNPRYRDVLAAADQPREFARRLQQAGYATDPAYGQKIHSILGRSALMTATGGETPPEREE
ncbi:flagellar assembly peptidoglycan hydrolase FlgJ [Marinobacter sp. C2H3]|uniref:flagellar assembly peptidoglycan hydrolase FlgJ n=1 Tax=Marinobacter sp. C2H3 TaxID=3119003 RepID=UPI00300F010A